MTHRDRFIVNRNRIQSPGAWAGCANCDHDQAHHTGGLLVSKAATWTDERQCWIWIEPPLKGSRVCPCPGWAPGPQR